MKNYVEIEGLLESGAHFGHLTRRWNPKMNPFIFTERSGIHIIDLRKTQTLVNVAREAAYEFTSEGKTILFVGTKSQAKEIVKIQALRCNTHYVADRWLGGMLTNFPTIRKSIKRLTTIDKMQVDGTFDKVTKKERLMLTREREKLRRVFGGIEEMRRLPSVLFVIDIKKEHIAINEARSLGIPVIGIVDTNCDPTLVDYPIPANDDSIKSIELITSIIADAVLEGNEIAKTRQLDIPPADKEQSDEDGQPKRKFRERRPGGGNNPRRGGNDNG
jgi:small subunit ribosomal protein S2